MIVGWVLVAATLAFAIYLAIDDPTLLLGYVRALSWPVVVLVVLWAIRDLVASPLKDRLRPRRAAGGEARIGWEYGESNERIVPQAPPGGLVPPPAPGQPQAQHAQHGQPPQFQQQPTPVQAPPPQQPLSDQTQSQATVQGSFPPPPPPPAV